MWVRGLVRVGVVGFGLFVDLGEGEKGALVDVFFLAWL